ncbi:MAG: InlB B-repeat-containing protein [Eubacteriales bacterium]|jgi:uncharacterized repeat protein (TIGR02543 family)
MQRKRFTSLLLVISLLLSAFVPLRVFAESEKTVIQSQSVRGLVGSTVKVNVVITNNPGIISAELTIDFDERLTLIKATSGEAFSALDMTKSGDLLPPCNFTWDALDISESDIKDGTILTLEFSIPKDIEIGTECPITINNGNGGIMNVGFQPVNANFINGNVLVTDFTYGDLNDDRKINYTDVVLLRREVAGKYHQTINKKAADLYSDGKLTTTDTILLRRFIVGGYGVTFPMLPLCVHALVKTEAKAPTCTENGNIAYWTCQKCGKYFADANGTTEISESGAVLKANGHTPTVIPGKPATYYETGLTDGSKCSVCNEILVKQEIIPMLLKDSYTIQYMNELVPSTNKDYYLQNDIVDHFHYTVGVEKALPTPKLDKYTFVGWTDENGELVGGNGKILPKGTTGDVVLYANWVSDRNKAKPAKELGKPQIFEDPDDNLIMFVYKIGTIENIPLYTTLNLQCVNGIITTISETTQTSIRKGNAKSVSDTIESITSGSSSWTLSEDWNKSTQVSKENTFSSDEERIHAEEIAKTDRGTYRIGSSYSDFESKTDSSGSQIRLSDNKSHVDYSEQEKNKSFGLSVDSKLSTATEMKLGAKVGAKLPSVATAALTGIPADVSGEVEAGWKNNSSFEISGGMDYKKSQRDFESHTDSWSRSIDVEKQTSHVKTSEKTWNFDSSFETSTETSRKDTISKAISQGLSMSSGVQNGMTVGGGNTKTEEFGSSDKTGRTNGSVVSFDTEEIKTVTHSFQSNGNTFGNYRMVMAGSADVYAVVGYDMLRETYFVYTYNVANKETEEYLDYSAVGGKFDDYEYSIIPFEIPVEVNDYVNARVLQTEGLEINTTTGVVERYEPYDKNDPDTLIVIPTYWRYFDTKDNQYHVIKVTGIDSELFKGHTEIVGVQLGKGIKEIPDSAFEGCTSLKGIYCPGVTKIGNKAFKGCTSLESFTVPKEITSVGEKAFEGIGNVKAYAANQDVGKAIISSGARQIVLDISKISDVKDFNINIEEGTELFELNGVGKTFEGLTIVSKADKTVLNGINITGEVFTPLKTSSATLVLDHTTIDSNGVAVILENPSTRILVNNQNEIYSRCDKAIVCGDVSIEKMQSNVIGKIIATGNVLTCGTVAGHEKYLKFASGTIVQISKAEYDNYKQGVVRVTFDGNGGKVDTTQADVVYKTTYGDKLPKTAVRTGYSFAGWYTEADGGKLITSESEVNQAENFTLYAHWKANSYRINFNVNATGATVSPDFKEVFYDNEYGTMPTPVLSGTSFVGWYTKAVDGERILSDTKVKTTEDQTLYAHWSRNAYVITFNANGGNVSISSSKVTYGEPYGTLPTPTRDYYTFTGWYTAANGGDPVKADTTMKTANNVVLYAHWQQNPVSGWVRASELPSGAEVTSRKYSYTKTYYTTSGSSSLSGWTHYNTTSAWSDYGAWSAWQDAYIGGSDSRDVATQEVLSVAGHTEYRYGAYVRADNGGHRPCGYCATGTANSTSAKEEWTAWSSNKATQASDYGYKCYLCNNHHDGTWFPNAAGSPGGRGAGYYWKTYWVNNIDYYWEQTRYVDPVYKTQYRYRDRHLIYTYYFYRNENLESTGYPSGSDISNITEWVQYRAK